MCLLNLRSTVCTLALATLLTACGNTGSGGNSSGTTGTGGTGGTGGANGVGGARGSGGAPQTAPAAKSAKRGVAYDLSDPLDFTALSPGVSWWYNWSSQPNKAVPADYAAHYGLDYFPMLWNGNYDSIAVESYLKAHPAIKYLLVLNEPNLTSQSNLTPSQAASIWPAYEAIAAHTGIKIVGPQLTWGTMPHFEDPVAWMDAFIAAYTAANDGRAPRIDYLAFHWYDYGLSGQLDRLTRYGKPFWVTEFANWHAQPDGGLIDTAAKQEAQMKDMVATCESRADVARYAWFAGRFNNDVHFTSLLSTAGQLTELGKLYISLPY